MSSPFEDPAHRRPDGTPTPFPSWERRRDETEQLLRFLDAGDGAGDEDDAER
jgi:hypothetical protein